VTVMPRILQSPLASLSITVVLGIAGVASLWYPAATVRPMWAVTWQLITGLGCAVAGHVITMVNWNSATGRLLVVAALILFAAAVVLAAGLPDLAHGLWVSAVLVTIPLALLRVVQPRPAAATMRVVDALATIFGLATAGATTAGFASAAVLLGMVSGAIVVCAAGLLFEMTADDDRRRVLWVILGFMLAVPASLLLLVAGNTAGIVTIVLALVAAALSLSLPLAAAIALIKPRIVDVRAVIEQVTVAALMFVLAAAVYIGTEAAIIILTEDIPPSGVKVLIAVGVAAGFHPVMRWVRASVNEMLFGRQADPLHTLALLGSHLAAGSSPPQWLDTLRIALAARGVALRQRDEIIAASGEFGASPAILTELRAGAEHVGDLVVVLAADDLRLTRATSAVADLVSVPLAQALHAARLTEDLRASRGHAVSALEEERRRMRRDLHDGLGPTLTGIAYSADAAANLLRSTPDEALQILRELRSEAGEAIAEIRRIVYGLRPRALDELGLVGAVQQQVSHMRTADGRVLTVTIDAPQDLPELPAAVEVAAYRTAVEAVTNVARHSGVAEATVYFALASGPALRIQIQDRGRSTTTWTPGVGMVSMRERIEQIGGTLTVHAGRHGATITAHIPITANPTAQQ